MRRAPDGGGQLFVKDCSNVRCIAAGSFHTVGLKSDGSLVACEVDRLRQA